MKLEIVRISKRESHKLKILKGFVVCGDIHLYNSYPYSTQGETISSRLIDLKNALFEIGETTQQLNLPLVLNGDIIHTGILDWPVTHVLTSFFKKFNDVRIFTNLGNHDLDGDYSVVEQLVNFAENSKHFVVTNLQKLGIYKGCKFWVIPYYSKTHTVKLLKVIAKELKESDINILFIHNSFAGALFANKQANRSGINQNMSSLAKFDLVVASDIHKHQTICKGHGFYTSSIIPLNFGELSKEHGYHIVDLNKKIRYFIRPEAPRFKYFKLRDLLLLDHKHVKKKVRGNIICIKTNVSVDKLDKREIINGLISLGALFVTFKMEHKEDKEETIEIKNITNIESIVSSYSNTLATKHKLKRKEVEKVGLKILKKAERELLLRKQRR